MTNKLLLKLQKDNLHDRCKELGIPVLKYATIQQLKEALNRYYKDAAVVWIDDGADLRHTDKPTTEYLVDFTIDVTHSVRAESREAANEWIEYNASDFYKPDFGKLVDIGGVNIFGVYKQDE